MHYYAHHQELATIMLITTLVVSFCKDRGGNVNHHTQRITTITINRNIVTSYNQNDKELHTEHTPLWTIILH